MQTQPPAYRYLRGYALDPGFSTRLDTAAINEVCYRIPYEAVEPGPVGEYLAVMDFDPASGCWYAPVDLSDEAVASQQGVSPSEGNPQFHQQLVYAAAMKTIHHFERALGRKIIWRGRITDRKSKDDGFVQRLHIHPHGIRDSNAYYDPDKRAVLFGYFTAANVNQGANYPGGIVFTCLSPDIVAHEMTHAILDAIHSRYLEDTNPDVGAFHEGFADIVALLQRFTFRELTEHQLFQTSGRLDRYSVLGELATQFGEALEDNRGALRHLIGQWVTDKDGKEVWEALKPSPTDYLDNTEEHDRGAVLVATIFDAFQRIYKHRTQDLLRIATNGTGVLPEGSISVDLVKRLAAEASRIAEHMLLICIRALDYCPPHDITFGDYLRALITADLDAAPADEIGYRVALIEAFRARGIFPDRVNTLSVESLRWSPPDLTKPQAEILSRMIAKLRDDIRDLVEARDRHDIYKLSRGAQAKLHGLLFEYIEKQKTTTQAENFLNQLGLTQQRVSKLFDAKLPDGVHFVRRGRGGKPGRADDGYVPKIEVHTVRPVFREGREDGRRKDQVIISLTQSIYLSVGEGDERQQMTFRGGCQLVLDLGPSNKAAFIVRMNVKSEARFKRQLEHLLGQDESGASSASLYADDNRSSRINFNLLHRH
jgi:hypothetical protein